MAARRPAAASPLLALLALLAVASTLGAEHRHEAVHSSFTTAPKDSDEAFLHEREKRTFFSKHSYVKESRGESYGVGTKNLKSPEGYQGGCRSRPNNPPNTVITCVTYSGCRLSCHQGYEFPNGERRLLLTCQDSKWKIEGSDWDTIPACHPICRPPCQNNGICVQPNRCNCSENFRGPQCQYESKPCFNDPPMPENSRRNCNTKTCTIQCRDGHQFPDGTSITNLICREGIWVPSRKDFSSIPDCQPVCNPPCLNGGNCLSYNMCQCPQDFKGPQCQYAKEVCSPHKLDFNGQYRCTGDTNSMSCHLLCPSGEFETPPAEAYLCQYAVGKYLPEPVPKCIYDSHVFTFPVSMRETFTVINSNSSNMGHINIIPQDNTPTLIKTPVSGTCYAWSDHYKTFDGRILSFKSNCSYTLVHEVLDNTFSVALGPKVNGQRNIQVFAQDKEYVLSRNDAGVPVLQVGRRRYRIPSQLPGVKVKYTAHFVELSFTSAGFSVLWDTESIVSIDVKESLWNRTAGLCGRMDGYSENDLQMKDGSIATRLAPFANSWQVERLGEVCSSALDESHPCNSPNSGLASASEARAFCDKLLTDSHFAACRSVVDVQPYYDACLWDYCSCQSGSVCACQAIAMFVWQCSASGVSVPRWRDATKCSMECGGGRVYMACNPENQPTCGSPMEIEGPSPILGTKESGRLCIEGCYCPRGTVLHEQQCIPREQCPCQIRGRVFSPGHVIPKDCNTCTCENGTWFCTQAKCSARCSCIGDPHYTTFDGRRYDFMGKCSYYLVKGENYSVEAENVACSGAFSKNVANIKSPSCAKSVTIRLGGKRIQLKQGHEVLVDGKEVPQLPVRVADAYVHEVSSVYILVELPNNLTIWWDGVTNIHVDAPPSLHGETRGLCGTFNMNQRDDFVTPEEDVEQSVIAFANKWKTEEVCENEPEKELAEPCDINPHKRESAEKYCSHLKGSLFESCHWLVDPEPYYHDCMYDMCSCQLKVGSCLCPMLAAYAKECTRKGVQVLWRNTVRECGMMCPPGQVYQVCGDTCSRSCQSIAQATHCVSQCVEGCNCPPGQTINDKTGECIPISQCPCQFEGLDFLPGFKDIRQSRNEQLLCTCEKAVWNCRLATSKEVKEIGSVLQRNRKCSDIKNETFTTCKPHEPLTCKNMHKSSAVSVAMCEVGCVCKKGFVLDHDSKHCIHPSECPCHHGGQSYSEGSSIQEECNTCTCKAGKWKCTENICPGICSAWGDSHFKTFDSCIFDFQGTCDYVLAKGVLSKDESFDISIQNVQCSSLGISCSKSVTLKVAHAGHHETISFVKEKALPSTTGMQRIQIRTAGLFVFAEVTDLGLVVQWDQGNRVYIKVDPKWKNKLKGLCGNYNDNMLDDFQTPSGGPAEVSAVIFGDSWRLQPYCPESMEITDSCTLHPNRKLWAMRKCGVLKSSVFHRCHSEVPVEPFLERCIFDTCACDLGGDCECLCTALAAYAHECNMHGVPIRWRSQKLCPMQCDEKCSEYSPCIETCPQTTCENQYIISSLTHLCKEDTCVEGCALKPCLPGHVFYNSSSFDCVPVASCKTVCLEINGIVYYEGDMMEQGECHTCYCSRHKKSCIGTPCSTPPPTVPNETPLQKCIPGWSQWINKNVIKGKKIMEEYEPVPILNSLKETSVNCLKAEMSAIECRTVDTHISHKEWEITNNVNISCNLDNGFLCRSSKCRDFEVRVLCDCGPEYTTFTSRPETLQPTEEITTTPLEQATSTVAVPESNKVTQACEPGDEWQSCGIPCSRVCLYYGYVLQTRGYCKSSEECYSGCVSEELSGGCPRGFVWRDHRTCVSMADCLCYSYSGKPVKPGVIINETDCETCQCINNQYVCDSRCETTPPPPPTPETTVVLTVTVSSVPSFVTPPLPCQQDQFIPLIEGKHLPPDEAFAASSSGISIGQQPSMARMHSKENPNYAWMPHEHDKNQYLQVKFDEIEPVYGVSVQGSSAGYVTSYHVLYSTNGNFYYYVMDRNNSPAVFRGPVDGQREQKAIFDRPIEAKFIRFHPLTWHQAIAMRIQAFGCAWGLTTLEPFTASSNPPVEECTEEMGLDNGMMSDQQVVVSSVRAGDFGNYGPSRVHLNGASETSAWMPATNDKDQWLQFDFLEPRNLSGFITKGLEKSGSWVEVFKVLYSHDGDIWNPLLGENGDEVMFPGNFDDKTQHANKFGRILQTRFLRLIPVEWHQNIAVRAEIIGCFVPYPEITTVHPVTSPAECLVCPGVTLGQMDEPLCRTCPATLWWDGESCVNRTHCPCVVEHNRYEVGKMYNTENCHECLCKLGGFPDCKRKECSNNCESGFLSTLTPSCGCVCKPCSPGTLLCPSSNICIEEHLWCNGVEDCPDDERNCTAALTTTAPMTTTAAPPNTPCPPVQCPPGTRPVKRRPGRGHIKEMGNYNVKGFGGLPTRLREISGACEPVECVSIMRKPSTNETCHKPICSPSHMLVTLPGRGKGRCGVYVCVPRHAMCNVTQRTVDTFDGVELKHSICNHILARDSEDNKWEVSTRANCSEIHHCSHYLNIKQDKYTINLHSDMSLDINGIHYSPYETKHLGGRYKPYAIYRVGDSLLFQSNHYGFWVIWDTDGSAKVGVTGKLYGRVDGLCGTFNGNLLDDRKTRFGNITRSNAEFVKSWAIPGLPDCEDATCPHHLFLQAQEICNNVRDEPLNQCESVVDLTRFIDRCVESTCSCLSRKNGTTGNCRCHALLNLVTQCQAADSSIDLSGWRTYNGCPAQCPAPLVHQDCFRHKCEPRCGAMQELESCDSLPGTCFSGCFCPDGFLRHNDQCLSPNECRDCVCNGFGDPQYLTFDRSNFTFNGNCTYVASRDKSPSGDHIYQVLVTNKQCPDEPASTCTEAVEIIYENHSVAIKNDFGLQKQKLQALVDGKTIWQFPHKDGSWLRLEHVESSEVSVLVLPIQLEVTYYIHNFGFTVRLPSQIFKNKTEGLCGNCNKNKLDDFVTMNGTVTNDPNQFAFSWLQHRTSENECQVTAEEGCKPLSPDEDPCLRLIDSPVFEKCRNILDPAAYVTACQFDLCHSRNTTDAPCRDMEAYVADCLEAGICLDWRSAELCPFSCPQEREYHACQHGCFRTCESLQEDKSNCTSVVLDGCYCPEGEVLEGGKCVRESKCFSCDTEGHFDGDTWPQDVCTNCTCVGSAKKCTQMLCPDVMTVCSEGMLPLEIPTSERECCKRVVCVPGPTPTTPTTCPTPNVPKCNEDQYTTTITDADGCNSVVCKCKPCPEEDFSLTKGEEELLPGFKFEFDHSGCCKKIVKKCYPEYCPKPKECVYPLSLEEIPVKHNNACCSDYRCVPPPNSCIINNGHKSSVVVKKVGSQWKETPCRSCECRDVSGTPELLCSSVLCPSGDMNVNVTHDYVVETRTKPEECCPHILISACRANNSVLEIGETVVDRQVDHCTTYSCEKLSNGDIIKRSEIQRCSVDCEEGWEYVKPEEGSDECCGQCRPIGCYHDGVLHHQGISWKSEDNCVDYYCSSINGTFQIETKVVNCLPLTEEVYQDYLIEEERISGECCKIPKYLACKFNGEVVREGVTIQAAENPCKMLTCERKPNGQLVQKEIFETCSTNCSNGWEYIPAAEGSGLCCGHCKQVSCIYEERIYAANTTWVSPDGCTEYECQLSALGQYEVIGSREECPSLKNCAPNNIYQDKCCKKCKISIENQTSCEARRMAAKETKSLISENIGAHGLCVNDALEGFMECEGRCLSKTVYIQETSSHRTICDCCQPKRYTDLSVSMTCEDGHTYTKTISVPSLCSCEKCDSKEHEPAELFLEPQ